MTFIDPNAFDGLSTHSGEQSPQHAKNGPNQQGAQDAMQVDDSGSSSSGSDTGGSPPRFTSVQKAKGKAQRVRTASEAGLSPPPHATRQFATDDDEVMMEDGQNVPYPAYNILEQGASDDDEAPEQGSGGFMADARKTKQGKRQTQADIERDFQVAAALQENESSPTVSKGQAPRSAPAPATSSGSSRRPDTSYAGAASGSSSSAPSGRATTGRAPSTAPLPAPLGTRPKTLPVNIWKLFKYKGGVTEEDLRVAAKDGLEVRYWAPSFPQPKGITFNTLTLFMDDSNRESWRALEGNVLIAWPADIAHADVDDLVHTIRTVCALVFNRPTAVKVFPADRNGNLQAPIAIIKFEEREHYVWMRDQGVINNSRRPFFVISRRRLPARITHTVTGSGWENNDEGRSNLEAAYRSAAADSEAVGVFANENHDAVDPKLNVSDYHQYLADSLTASPLDVFKRGTQIPAVHWRIECARMTRDEDKVKSLNSIIKNLRVRGGVYGTPQVIRAPKCGMCGCVYHPSGKCEVAEHPSWLGPRVKTAASKAAAPAEPEEDETLPNGNMRRTAALLKETPAQKGNKFDKKGDRKSVV